MKKTIAAALAAAVVMGTGATTFANPFSDVPAGHWAYRAIQSLQDEGIIEGYGDDTYRGDRLITRYEMAQMIAKAMAKTDPAFASKSGVLNTSAANSGVIKPHNIGGSSKAELDRLAAEFRDELDALGVRVAELEKYADKVVWTGELRYRYYSDREDIKGSGGHYKPTKNQLQLRLFPTATVNDHWKIKARMTASADMKTDESGNFKLTYAFAEGKYFDDKLTLMVGKMPFYTNVDDGLVMDDFFSGFTAIYGDKFKVALMAGRWDMNNANLKLPADTSLADAAASYQGGEISYDNDKLYIGAGYHHFRSDDFRNLPGYKNNKNANVWTVGARYNFSGGFKIGGAYAQNTKADQFKKAWYAGLGYKGANKKVPGSWGISANYRYVGQNASLAPTYDTFALRTNKKGVEIMADWTPIYNTYVQAGYFWGKTLDTREDDKTLFGRVSWFF